jgi:hypothetical protein
MKGLHLTFSVLFAIGFFFFVIAMVRAQKRCADGTPRDMKKQQKHTLLFFCLLLVWNMHDLLRGSPLTAISAVNLFVLGGMLLWLLYTLPRPPREAEARANYRAKPEICGRCDYDLTGNTSGTCPECGWKLNSDPLPLDSSTWAMWWRGWRIESLENWKRTLALCVWLVVVFVAACVVILARGGHFRSFAFFTGLLTIHFALNAVRAWQYGRSQPTGPTHQPADSHDSLTN